MKTKRLIITVCAVCLCAIAKASGAQDADSLSVVIPESAINSLSDSTSNSIPESALQSAAELVNESARTLLEVNYKKLEKFVRDKPEEYAQLVARFVAADTTLTIKEIGVVYYGHTCTDKYSPYATHSELTKAAREGTPEDVLNVSKNILQSNPVALRVLYYAAMAADALGNRAEAENYAQRVSFLLETIFASGDGMSKEKPAKVICVDDEYVFIQLVVGAQVKGQAFDGKHDIMTIVRRPDEGESTDEEENTMELYFDISRAVSKLPF